MIIRFSRATLHCREWQVPSTGYIVKLLIPVDSITVNDKPWLLRSISVAGRIRVVPFRDAAHDRDHRCVITGRRAISGRGALVGFRATYIFPLAYEDHWIDRRAHV